MGFSHDALSCKFSSIVGSQDGELSGWAHRNVRPNLPSGGRGTHDKQRRTWLKQSCADTSPEQQPRLSTLAATLYKSPRATFTAPLQITKARQRRPQSRHAPSLPGATCETFDDDAAPPSLEICSFVAEATTAASAARSSVAGADEAVRIFPDVVATDNLSHCRKSLPTSLFSNRSGVVPPSMRTSRETVPTYRRKTCAFFKPKMSKPLSVACGLAKSCVKPLRRRRNDPESPISEVQPLTIYSHLEPEDEEASICHKSWVEERRKINAGCSKSGVRSRPELDGCILYNHIRRFNLPADTVLEARRLFKRYDIDCDGALDKQEFHTMLRSLLREQFPDASTMPREFFKKADELADRTHDGKCDFQELLLWLSEYSFHEWFVLPSADRQLRHSARMWGVPVVQVEGVKQQFDSFDDDGSGYIELAEFRELLARLLKMPEGTSLPESRVISFWKEIDKDGSGVVDFNEFMPWYMRYFDLSGNHSGVSPIEEFYQNIRGCMHTNPTHTYSHSVTYHEKDYDW